MVVPNEIGAEFFEELARAGQRALLLDYDGTLAPFRIERNEAIPYPGVREVLNTVLAAGHTRVVVISGRALQDLEPLLGLEQRPELWGSHGWERLLPDGSYILSELNPRAEQGLVTARRWLEAHGWSEHCETKPVSVALHWRGQAQEMMATMRARTEAYWVELAEQTGLVPHLFDGGIELRPSGRDKGVAVRILLEELPPTAKIAFLGDDMTDEDGFLALRDRGVGILVRMEYRLTAACYWLQPPDALLQFLWRWHDACSRTRSG